MKIVIVSPTLSFGGAERTAVRLSNWLSKKKHDVYFFNMSIENKSYIFNDNVNVYNLNLDLKKVSFLKKKILIKRFLYDNLCRIKPDVIFIILKCYILEFILYKLLNKKTVVISSERNNPKMRQKGILSDLKKNIFPLFCDGYIFQTDVVRKMYLKKVQKNSVVIQNSVAFKDDKFEKKEKIVISVGRLNKQKAQDILIKAFSVVLQKHPDYILVIYGEGQERNYLESIIKELKLENNVFLPGNKDDIYQFLKKAEIFVLSSIYEGMPNALMEAMAAGLPCVSTNCVAGPSELINDGVNGFLVPVNDYIEIANKINSLIENEKLRKIIGNNAKKILITNSEEEIFSKYLDYFVKCTK